MSLTDVLLETAVDAGARIEDSTLTTAVQPARAALAATRETGSAANVAGNEE